MLLSRFRLPRLDLPFLPARRLILLLLVGCCSPALLAPVRAQVNTETMRVADDTTGIHARFGASLLARGGNKSVTVVGGSSRIEYRNGRHAGFIEGKLQVLGNDGDVIFSTGFGHLRYTLKSSFATWFSYEAFTQIDTDRGRFLEQRRLAGAGLRFRIVKRDSVSWYFGSLPMVEYEALDPSNVDSESPMSTVARLSSFLFLDFRFRGRIGFSNVTYVQPRFDRPSDVRILDQAILRIALTRRMSFDTTFELRYDSDPPDELELYDFSIQNGLTFRF